MSKTRHFFHNAAGGAAIAVRVTPNAKTNQLVGVMADGTVKIKVSAPAVEGAANAALLAFLADLLGVRERDLELVAGQTGRDKLICVLGMDAQAVQQRLMASLAG